jgi:ketosteroid isomerase-like protein
MGTKEIVQGYFDGIAKKNGWETFISEEMSYTLPASSGSGKAAYVGATSRFLRVVDTAKVTRLIIEGDNACAIVRYELLSPKGNRLSADIAEILSVKNGKIASSAIFFDTAAFQDFMAKG